MIFLVKSQISARYSYKKTCIITKYTLPEVSSSKFIGIQSWFWTILSVSYVESRVARYHIRQYAAF